MSDFSSPGNHRPEKRFITLPSGKKIEIITWQDEGVLRRDLHICPECTSKLVYPTAWEEAEGSKWEVGLRCPNCEWIMTDVFEEELIIRFDEELDRGTQILVADLREAIRSRMEEDAEVFARAIHLGHILPEDF